MTTIDLPHTRRILIIRDDHGDIIATQGVCLGLEGIWGPGISMEIKEIVQDADGNDTSTTVFRSGPVKKTPMRTTKLDYLLCMAVLLLLTADLLGAF